MDILYKLFSLSVFVADGNKLQVCLRIHETVFESECMLLPSSCCDMVLGIQWLITLGPIVWDFQHLTMEFMVNGGKLVLRGSEHVFLKLRLL